MSLRPLVEGRGLPDPRDVIRVECEIGGMIRTDSYKYLKCFEGENAEQLYDLQDDPHETRNAAHDPDKQAELHRHRRLFAATFLR